MNNRESFYFYRSYYEAIKSMPYENQVTIYNSIFAFIFEDIEPELEGIEKTVWTLILPLLKANRRNYLNGNKPKRSQSEATTEPSRRQGIRNKDKGIKNKDNIIPAELVSKFNLLWEKYPRKIGKKEALRHYQASIKTEDDFTLIEKSLNNYMAYIKRNSTEEKYIQHGSTWFNNWQDWLNSSNNQGKIDIGGLL